MVFGIVLTLFTMAVTAAIVLPMVFRVHTAPARSSYERTVYLAQLKELDNDSARGLLNDRDAAGTRLEIERRLLGTERQTATLPHASAIPVIAVVLALGIPLGSMSLYLGLGSPSLAEREGSTKKQPAA